MTYVVSKEMAPTQPRRIGRLVLKVRLPQAGRQLPVELLERAANSCPVHQSLSSEIEKIIEFV